MHIVENIMANIDIHNITASLNMSIRQIFMIIYEII